jgi:hypothetical protein
MRRRTSSLRLWITGLSSSASGAVSTDGWVATWITRVYHITAGDGTEGIIRALGLHGSRRVNAAATGKAIHRNIDHNRFILLLYIDMTNSCCDGVARRNTSTIHHMWNVCKKFFGRQTRKPDRHRKTRIRNMPSQTTILVIGGGGWQRYVVKRQTILLTVFF